MLTKHKLLLVLIINFLSCSSPQIYKDDIIIYPRSTWKAEEPRPYRSHSPNKITIHHEGTFFPQDSIAFRHIRNIQLWGMRERKWIDIPYHFLIDGFGNIIEGRNVLSPGETNTSYDPTNHILISIIGEYNKKQELNNLQYNSLIKLIAKLCRDFNIKTDSIKGHRDYCKEGETDCPGDNIYKLLQSGKIKSDVEKVLKNKY